MIQNNRWAESVTVKLQTAVEDLSVKAQGYGIPGITVDGNDVVAVYRVAQEAIHRARIGDGPTLIEGKTYRWYGHSEIDPAKYRAPAEVEEWNGKGPDPGMEHYLAKHNCGPTISRKTSRSSTRTGSGEFAEKSPYPEPEEALDHVYSFGIRERELDRKSMDCRPSFQQIKTSGRTMALSTYIDAIKRADEEMKRDESVYIIGEDVGVMGGAFKATKGLRKNLAPTA